jgi:hypothetical protein
METMVTLRLFLTSQNRFHLIALNLHGKWHLVFETAFN